MTESKPASPDAWHDPDDAPEWTDAMFDAAEFSPGVATRTSVPTRLTTGTLAEHRRSMPRAVAGGVYAMADKKTSPKAAKAASKTLSDGRTAKDSKTAAGSALSQKEPSKKKK